MTILSDATIAAGIANGLFIERGDPASLGACSYKCKPGKIFFGGDHARVVDWTVPQRDAVFKIEPGAMVWIRMRERVKLPHNVCAQWWQTHSLSKKGIMLVNSSLVDPGYEGQLACLFVNFGKSSVAIHPSTTVAKLQFHLTDRDVNFPYLDRLSDIEYDEDLHDVALDGAPSFLNVADLSKELVVQKEKILQDIAEDAPKRVRGAFVWAFLGLIFLVAALSFVPWLQTKIAPNLKTYVDRAVDERLVSHLSRPIDGQLTQKSENNSTRQEDQIRIILQRLNSIEAKLANRSRQSNQTHDGPVKPIGRPTQ